MNTFTMDKLKRGSRGKIVGVSGSGAIIRRLLDIGFAEGAEVECVLRRRGIAAYLISGAVIALRDEDARVVKVKA